MRLGRHIAYALNPGSGFRKRIFPGLYIPRETVYLDYFLHLPAFQRNELHLGITLGATFTRSEDAVAEHEEIAGRGAEIGGNPLHRLLHPGYLCSVLQQHVTGLSRHVEYLGEGILLLFHIRDRCAGTSILSLRDRVLYRQDGQCRCCVRRRLPSDSVRLPHLPPDRFPYSLP